MADLKNSQSSNVAGINMGEREKWLEEELDTLEKVSEEASKIENGLTDWIQDDHWLREYKQSSKKL